MLQQTVFFGHIKFHQVTHEQHFAGAHVLLRSYVAVTELGPVHDISNYYRKHAVRSFGENFSVEAHARGSAYKQFT